MIFVKQYLPRMKDLWDAFVDSSKNGTFMLKRDYMDYHADRFDDCSLVFESDKGEIVAILPASRHGASLQSHGGLTYGGIICNRKMTTSRMLEVFDALKGALPALGIHQLLYKRVPHIYHTYPADEDLYALFRHDAKLVRRDMSSAIFLADRIRFGKGRRWMFKKAQKEGLEIRQSSDFATFINLLTTVLQKYHKVSPVHNAQELALLAERFPGNIKLFGAFARERMLAGVVMFETPNVAHTQYMANSDEGKELGALDLVVQPLVEQYSTDKQWFDFGISTVDEGRVLNVGLVSQKEEFGARGIVHDFYMLDA